MERPGAERKLAAILAADVVAYSRLMQTDDRATLSSLTERRALFSDKAAAHGGRIVNAPGDSILAEFASVVDAVECAIGIQRALAQLNAGLPEARRMEFRIGINVGDVLVDGAGAIYGDGVNIAARLESLAIPGGICLSKSARDQLKNRFGFEDLGEKSVKNIADPIHVYRVVAGDVRVARPSESLQNSIAVLAFENKTGDPAQERFGDGISDDIITDLSKISGIAVISGRSAFTYKGKATDLRTIGRELGVRYVLEGSVRRAGSSLRVNARLLEADSGAHLWANRYDRPMDDVFLVGDEITDDIVTSLDVKLSHGEAARVYRKALRSGPARECFIRAMESYYRGTSQDLRSARDLYNETSALEPGSPWGYAMAAVTHCLEVIQGWSGDPAHSLEEARRLGAKACGLDNNVPGGHVALGVVALYEDRHDEALDRLERARDLRPMCSAPLAMLGYGQMYSGRWEDAARSASEAVLLNPKYPAWYDYLRGAAKHFGGRNDEALPTLRQVRAASPGLVLARLPMIAAQSALGRDDEARAEAACLLQDQPDFSVTRFAGTQPFRDKVRRDAFLDTLRAAGLRD